ncbi:hypothetical protein BT69DRAFT_1286697 [Atractiella rhizophila]|nr:hypothetical protein BT69DRAFT_1286755 [Atractiella rhizophila]KAH8917416.1 hypothetical protein BT69DRAFT_1286697 [Atractiella rhizophila]
MRTCVNLFGKAEAPALNENEETQHVPSHPLDLRQKVISSGRPTIMMLKSVL